MGAKQRLEVELEDVDGPEGVGLPPADAAVARSRRLTRVQVRVLAAAGAVVLALVGAQLVLDARGRARIADLAGLPAVVTDLSSPPRVVAGELDEPLPGWEYQVLRPEQDGLPSVVRRTGDDAITLDGVRDGDVVWSVPLRTVDPPADGWNPYPPQCTVTPGDETTATCLVGDGGERWADQHEDVPQTSAVVLVVALADGRVVHEHVLEPNLSRTLGEAGDRIVLAEREGGGDASPVVVTAHDPATWDVLWRTRVPTGARPAGYSTQVFTETVPDLVAVDAGQGATLLAAVDGSVLRAADGVAVSGWVMDRAQEDVVALALSAQPADGQRRVQETELWTADGMTVFPGDVLGVHLDDGSLGDVVLTTDGTDLRAWDRDGTARWTAEGVTGWSVMVVDGRVLVDDDTTLHAVDGRTGRALWEHTARTDMSIVATDGRVVVVQEGLGAQDEVPLTAVGLTDGHEVWRTTVDDVSWVSVADGRLVGQRDDGTPVPLG
ncbi:hypothetical protein [Cellulomonas sp. SLBN-39]|uniref:hypothetical protein n=1 Tax=Cellulomonas sp. SLBN-39 TaxID=2768446 RepID=UPI00114DA8A0|nr:hypothetical protein [Cellulomonas sp. SLBN-39]TQL01451.1 hypothetical protein FBY24_0501 [Cellulomonas sp. SLBN-39]